ncbi:MAG TPA: hypothetical protein VF886_05455, partial [Roseiarcus sp.]
MNEAMAWTIAGMGQRTQDAAEEAARRAGMRLADWIDEAIADQAALEQGARPESDKAEDERLDAAAGRLERIARRNAPAREPGIPDSFNSAIGRFEARLSRAEGQAARAFESVAEILERSNAARDGDRQALIHAVRRLEAISVRWSGPAQAGEGMAPEPRLDLKAAVSQIAMRRHDLDARAGSARAAPSQDAPARAERPLAADSFDAPTAVAESALASPPPESLRDDIRALAIKLDDLRREQREPLGPAVDLGAMRAEITAMSKSLADLAPRNAMVALEGAIGDLMRRVEMVRQDSHGESLLAPLVATAAELRAALKTHDPQAV